MSYDELLQRLSVDLPAVIPGFVPSSLNGSSGSIPAPSKGSTLVWDSSEQLFVPAPLAALGIKVWARVSSSSPTTTSTNETTWATLPDLVVTDSFSGGPVICWLTANFTSSTNPSSWIDTTCLLDGAVPTGTRIITAMPSGVSGGGVWAHSRCDQFTPSAGSHTLAYGWATQAGTAQLFGDRGRLIVVQLPAGFQIN